LWRYDREFSGIRAVIGYVTCQPEQLSALVLDYGRHGLVLALLCLQARIL